MAGSLKSSSLCSVVPKTFGIRCERSSISLLATGLILCPNLSGDEDSSLNIQQNRKAMTPSGWQQSCCSVRSLFFYKHFGNIVPCTCPRWDGDPATEPCRNGSSLRLGNGSRFTFICWQISVGVLHVVKRRLKPRRGRQLMVPVTTSASAEMVLGSAVQKLGAYGYIATLTMSTSWFILSATSK